MNNITSSQEADAFYFFIEKHQEYSKKHALDSQEEESELKKQKTSSHMIPHQLGQETFPIFPPDLNPEEMKQRYPLSYVTFHISEPHSQEDRKISILKNVLMSHSKKYKQLFSQSSQQDQQITQIKWASSSYLALKHVCEFMELKSKILLKEHYKPLEKRDYPSSIFNEVYAICHVYQIKKLEKECQKLIPLYFTQGMQKMIESFYMAYNYSFKSNLENTWLDSFATALNTFPQPDQLYELIIRLASIDFSHLKFDRVLTIHIDLIQAIKIAISSPLFIHVNDQQLIIKLYHALFDLIYLNTSHTDLQLSNFFPYFSLHSATHLQNFIKHPHFIKACTDPKVKLLYIYTLCLLKKRSLKKILDEAATISDENLKQIGLGLIYFHYSKLNQAYSHFTKARSQIYNKKLQLDLNCLIFEINLKKNDYKPEETVKKLLACAGNQPLTLHYLWQKKGMWERITNHQIAIISFAEALKIRESAQCWKLKANSYYELKQYEFAVAAFVKCREFGNQDPHIIALQGHCHAYLKNFQLGLDLCTTALDSTLDHPIFLKTLKIKGLCHYNLNNYAAAIKDYEYFIQFNKKDIEVFCNLASSYLNLSKFKLASDMYDEVLKLQKNNVNDIILSNIFLCHIKLEKYHEAIKQLDEILKVRVSPLILVKKGLCYVLLNKDQQAFVIFKELIKVRSFGLADFNLVISYYKNFNRLEPAEQLFNEYLEHTLNQSDKQKIVNCMQNCLIT